MPIEQAQNSGRRPVEVFLSYSHQDAVLAQCIKDKIETMNPEKILVHIDHEFIQAGDEYRTRISRNIIKSDMFLLLNPGPRDAEKKMDYCLTETGMFYGKLGIPGPSHDGTDSIPLAVLYDEDIPDFFASYQQVNVLKTKQRTTITVDLATLIDWKSTFTYDYLEQLLKRSDPELKTDSDLWRGVLEEKSRAITMEFLKLKRKTVDVPLFPRISFIIERSGQNQTFSIPTNMLVKDDGNNALTRIFNITAPTTTWGTIKERVRSVALYPIWFMELCASIRAIASDKNPDQTDMICLGQDGLSYRPIIGRYLKYNTGALEIFISFVPCRPKELVPLDGESGFLETPKWRATKWLLVCLLLSIRFRERVLPLFEKAQACNDIFERLKILFEAYTEIIWAEDESREYGLPPSKDLGAGRHPLLDELQSEGAKRAVSAMIAMWRPVRYQLDQISSKGFIDEFGVITDNKSLIPLRPGDLDMDLSKLRAGVASVLKSISTELSDLMKAQEREASGSGPGFDGERRPADGPRRPEKKVVRKLRAE